MCCADFKKAKCLMNAEVSLVLQRKYEQLQQLADDPSAQISQCVINCSGHKHQQVVVANIQEYLVVLSLMLMFSILISLSIVARIDAVFTVDIDIHFLNYEVIQKNYNIRKTIVQGFREVPSICKTFQSLPESRCREASARVSFYIYVYMSVPVLKLKTFGGFLQGHIKLLRQSRITD